MPLITISSPLGCGGVEIGKRVADELNLEIYDDQKLIDMAPEVGIPSDDLKGMSEPGFFDRLFSNKPHVYMDYMDSIIYEVSRQGNGVILGHGSQMLLRDFGCALHVRIHASESTRIQNVTKHQGLSSEAAIKLIHKMDSKRKGLFRLAFGNDLDDPSLYDLIINTEKIGYDSASKFIMEAARSEEVSTCSLTALESMEKLSQVKRIEAALLEQDLLHHSLFIEVNEKGLAEIRGIAYSQEIADRITAVVKEVSGISEVKLEIAVTSSLL